MGAALASGLLLAGWSEADLAVVEREPGRREELGGELAGVDVGPGPFESKAIVLAVKPLDAESACRSAAEAGAARILSVMAGVPISSIESWTGGGRAIMRAMPNTPALVGAGVSGLAGGPGATGEDLDWAESILGSVGVVVRVDETDLDAVTGLSGSGPAYIFLVTEALEKAGVNAGLDPETSRVLARQTVVGAGRLLGESELEPGELRGQVTSPGGTTEAGVAALKAGGLEETIGAAVLAAAERAGQLARTGSTKN
jgi:pyrroline-5-carboxylate reductase